MLSDDENAAKKRVRFRNLLSTLEDLYLYYFGVEEGARQNGIIQVRA